MCRSELSEQPVRAAGAGVAVAPRRLGVRVSAEVEVAVNNWLPDAAG